MINIYGYTVYIYVSMFLILLHDNKFVQYVIFSSYHDNT